MLCCVLMGVVERRRPLIGQEEALFFSSAGIWNLIISLTAIECMASPNTPRRSDGGVCPVMTCCGVLWCGV